MVHSSFIITWHDLSLTLSRLVPTDPVRGGAGAVGGDDVPEGLAGALVPLPVPLRPALLLHHTAQVGRPATHPPFRQHSSCHVGRVGCCAF